MELLFHTVDMGIIDTREKKDAEMSEFVKVGYDELRKSFGFLNVGNF